MDDRELFTFRGGREYQRLIDELYGKLNSFKYAVCTEESLNSLEGIKKIYEKTQELSKKYGFGSEEELELERIGDELTMIRTIIRERPKKKILRLCLVAEQ